MEREFDPEELWRVEASLEVGELILNAPPDLYQAFLGLHLRLNRDPWHPDSVAINGDDLHRDIPLEGFAVVVEYVIVPEPPRHRHVLLLAAEWHHVQDDPPGAYGTFF
ncbi:hypothetical protein ACIQ9P_18035 [Kitasatospora sp. NPDC094019]|uniref:hypothetical protein n=1 Tax=Kitasatospora sp. NPDC094019 TaxID=3364091 RepID=UPI00382759D3